MKVQFRAKVSLLILVGVGLWGCQKMAKEIPPAEPSRAASSPSASAAALPAKKSVFSAKVREIAKPNRYLLVLQWEDIASDPQYWTIDKREGEITLSPFTTVPGNMRRYTDLDVVAGRTYTYTLKADLHDSSEPLETVTVTIPRDLEIHGVRAVESIQNTNRLFLYPDSRLITEGKDVAIEVNEILSDNGTIESFLTNASASHPGADGRPAKDIRIHTKRGTGLLHVIARGENGGAGERGTSGPPGIAGKTGGCVVCKTISEPAYCIGSFAPPGDGQAAGDGSRGGPGGRGGDSPKVLVEIENPEGLTIEVDKIAGRGGAGGAGGLAGRGGAAGMPYPSDAPPGCRYGHPGNAGPDGRPGLPGERGADGTTRPTCVKLGKTLLGNCEAFPAPKP